MRWRLAFVLVILVATGVVAVATPAGACSQIAADGGFVGRAEAIDGEQVTFIVERVESSSQEALDITSGQRVPIDFESDVALLDTGSSYAVPVWNVDGKLTSFVGRDIVEGGCGLQHGTTNADGTFIDRSGWPLGRVGMGLTLAGALVAAVFLGRRRRNVGQPSPAQL